MSHRLVGVLTCLFLGSSCLAAGDSVLPIVPETAFEPVRTNVQRLLQALDRMQAPLPPEASASLQHLLNQGHKDSEAIEKIQKLLDPFCVIGVTINPESRVKAARGAAPADLVQARPKVFLIKVQNDAGVTQSLRLFSPQQTEESEVDSPRRWLTAAIFTKPPMREKLSGQALEYLILRVSSRETGKREATLIFDVGQGTQDLGFRAEVPILFTIRPK